LDISRESAYRRIRGDIPFTLDELVKLTTNMDLSIDTIFEQEKENGLFDDFSKIEKKTINFFVLMINKYDGLLEKIKCSKKIEVIVALNTFPPPFCTCFSNLFKFSYYKWLYQDNDNFRIRLFSEVILPDEAISFQKKTKKNFIPGSNVTIILDKNIFRNLIKEIQYYYQRQLLTFDEMLLLKEDTLNLIEEYEKIVQTGSSGSAKVQIYLSSLCVNSNTVYYDFGSNADSLFWIVTTYPVVIQNTRFISLQLKWLNLLKRQSVLVTQSNEIMQAEFFSQQREYVKRYLI
jgi:hypothetical protein